MIKIGNFVRKRLRKRNTKARFTCLYSDELRPLQEEPEENERLPNGSTTHITGTFGFHLAGLVIQDVLKPFKEVRAYS